MRYGFVIDTTECIGCHSCAVACKTENNLPDTIWWNKVLTHGGEEMECPAGEYPNCSMSYLPMACQHCNNPACVKVCPVGATYIEEGTGAVMQNAEACIGCRMCIAACPYSGTRSYNWDEPAFALGFAAGGKGAPAHIARTVEKCTMCSHRREEGLEPACISACPARARYFGDFDDPESEVSRLVRERSTMQLLAERGTDPSTRYVI